MCLPDGQGQAPRGIAAAIDGDCARLSRAIVTRRGSLLPAPRGALDAHLPTAGLLRLDSDLPHRADGCRQTETVACQSCRKAVCAMLRQGQHISGEALLPCSPT